MKLIKLLLSIGLFLGCGQLVGGALNQQLILAIDQYVQDVSRNTNPNFEAIGTLLNQGADPDFGLELAIRSFIAFPHDTNLIEYLLQKGAKHIADNWKDWLQRQDIRAQTLKALLKKYNINIG